MFKIGDKVQVVNHINYFVRIGMVGIVEANLSSGQCRVRFPDLLWKVDPNNLILSPGDDDQESVATKYDSDKVRLELLSPIALMEIGKVLTQGAKKYEDHNWRKGFKWSRLLGAALRHLMAFIGGQDKDPETGLSHLAHLGCCVLFLLEHEVTHKELDDRYKIINNE